MRLTFKLIIALTLTILVVLGLNAFVRINREATLFEEDIRKDGGLMGTALAGAVSRIWTTVGEAEALDLVSDADERLSHMVIRWVWLADDDTAASRLDAGAREQLAAGKLVIIKGRAPNERVRSLYTYVPVALPDGRVAAVELRESLGAEHKYLKKTIIQAIVTTGALVLICGVLAMALGVIFVGRPVRRLVDQARRIGRGDLSPEITPGGNDEISELASEMNAMCLSLLEARTSLEAETASRLAAQEQLRHADRLTTVGKLAAGIAHEVGTPLNVITGHAQIIKEEYPADSVAHENVLIISEQAHRVAAIIRQLLDFARQRTLQKASHDLGEIARRVATLLAPLAQKHRVTIEVDSIDDALVTEVDAGQLQQVVTNLVVNGIQSMTGGGILSLGTEKTRKKNPTDPSGELMQVSAIYVQDHGPGITKDALPRIFEPFFTTKEVGEGTGLGLSVAYGIIKEHGGWIDVESAIRQGTRFTVYLPTRRDDHE